MTRNVLEYLTQHPRSVNLERDYDKMQTNLQIFQNKYRKLLDLERTHLEESKRLIVKWKKRNDRISREIESKSLHVEKIRELHKDPCRKRNEESRKMRLAAIARRTKLITKAEDNYEQLLILHARLEVLKLRTYPTLKLKNTSEI